MKLGRYKHYKGREYEVIGIATHSETRETLVVYKELYGKNNLWVRPVEMFNDRVLAGGKFVARFKYAGDGKSKICNLNDDYVIEMIRFLSEVAVGDNPPRNDINLEGLNLFFCSIGVSDDTFESWSKEFFILNKYTLPKYVQCIQYQMEEFFIRKYRVWYISWGKDN